MSEEKKTVATEEVKEEVRKLTEEELEQVSGGAPTIRVKEDDVAVLNTTTASDALQGKVPGVEIAEKAGKPGEKSEIRVR